MTNEEFIHRYCTEDVQRLALLKAPEGVDMKFCLQQIEGWQTATRKLPMWSETEGVLYPPRLSMEQCSSEETARYKQQLVCRILSEDKRLSMVDLTGGFGIDFSYLAKEFREATYVEKQEILCRMALHNMPLMGLGLAHIVQSDCMEYVKEMPMTNLVFMDPARRDSTGRKTVALQDCTPDVRQLVPQLMSHTDLLLLKLSPMLDITQAVRELPDVREVHIVSVNDECKELLLALQPNTCEHIVYHCVNLGKHEQYFQCEGCAFEPKLSELPQGYLYEPNVSILKAGVQDALCDIYRVKKLHPYSHLFTSDICKKEFPGRIFQLDGFSGFGKTELKSLIGDLKQANLTIRNFPSTVAELRKRLRLQEGSDVYLFATTLKDGRHALLRCSKITLESPAVRVEGPLV